MNQALIDQVTSAVLYEGYILYPYRPSLKNQHRWTFGGLYPRAYCQSQADGNAWQMQTQCLVQGGPQTQLQVTVRFLQLTQRTAGELPQPLTQWSGDPEPAFQPVDTLHVGSQSYPSWQEATERQAVLEPVSLASLLATSEETSPLRFEFPGGRSLELVHGAEQTVVGVLAREQQTLSVRVSLAAEELGPGQYRISVQVTNETELDSLQPLPREKLVLYSLASTHTILTVQEGAFVSLTDPPEELRQAVDECHQVGVWPVLVGEPGETDAMLASPIILYDYPQVAPESPGDLFDCTEIDEILTLRILTLTEDEQREMLHVDPRAGDLLARTQSLAREQLLGLHGTPRGLRPLPPGAS